jgi:hypothetical protein
MAFTDVAEMAGDADLRQRIYACAANQGIDNVVMWVDQWVWQIVGADDAWVQAWSAAALATSGTLDTPRRGWDAAVISDAMILARVRAVREDKGAI